MGASSQPHTNTLHQKTSTFEVESCTVPSRVSKHVRHPFRELERAVGRNRSPERGRQPVLHARKHVHTEQTGGRVLCTRTLQMGCRRREAPPDSVWGYDRRGTRGRKRFRGNYFHRVSSHPARTREGSVNVVHTCSDKQQNRGVLW